MQLYAMPVMSEVELEVYHQMDPSLILSELRFSALVEIVS